MNRWRNAGMVALVGALLVFASLGGAFHWLRVFGLDSE